MTDGRGACDGRAVRVLRLEKIVTGDWLQQCQEH